MKLSQIKSRFTKGKTAEMLACDYLKQNGLTLIEQNFHGRQGEIDIIMQHLDTLVFVEVRYRKNHDFGGAVASITLQKQHRIRQTALYYMQKQGRELNARFDVIAMTGTNEIHIDWIQNAF